MTMTPSLAVRIDVHVDRDDRAALGADVRAGLGARPKWLPPKWLYDREGCALFERITGVAEYYPSRRERSILAAHAPAIAGRSGADTLVELGSGSSDKSRFLLDAMAGTGNLRRFVPFEISLATLTAGAVRMADAYPGLEVHAVAGDFERHLDRLPIGGPPGRLPGRDHREPSPGRRAAFLASLAAGFEAGDTLLLGTDLVKEPSRLVAAYDDDAGVTAAFNRNILRRMNRELDADFDLDRFVHVAHWDDTQEWIEMRLRARGPQSVRIAALDMAVDFADGEHLRTEISAKFRRHRVVAELAAAGLETIGWWADDHGDYALSLSVLHECPRRPSTREDCHAKR